MTVNCPECGAAESTVIDSRDSKGFGTRRRRVCAVCEARFSTMERVIGTSEMREARLAGVRAMHAARAARRLP